MVRAAEPPRESWPVLDACRAWSLAHQDAPFLKYNGMLEASREYPLRVTSPKQVPGRSDQRDLVDRGIGWAAGFVPPRAGRFDDLHDAVPTGAKGALVSALHRMAGQPPDFLVGGAKDPLVYEAVLGSEPPDRSDGGPRWVTEVAFYSRAKLVAVTGFIVHSPDMNVDTARRLERSGNPRRRAQSVWRPDVGPACVVAQAGPQRIS